MASWLAVGVAIEYLLVVRPRVALAVHERVLTVPLILNPIPQFTVKQWAEFVVLGHSHVRNV